MDETSLSMTPRSVPAAGAALATHTLAECEALARLALQAGSAREARDAVRAAA